MKPSGPNSGKIPNGKEVLTTGKKTTASCQRWISSLSLERLTSFFLCRMSSPYFTLGSGKYLPVLWPRLLIFTLPCFLLSLPLLPLVDSVGNEGSRVWILKIDRVPCLSPWRQKRPLDLFHPLRISGRLEPSCASSRLSRTSNLTIIRELPQVLYSLKATMSSSWLEFRDIMFKFILSTISRFCSVCFVCSISFLPWIS